MSDPAGIHPKYLILSADLLSDLGNQFVQLTLLDLLILRGENALSNLLIMCMIEQAPSIILSPLAGLWIDRAGGRNWLLAVSLGKALLVAFLAYKLFPWIIFPAYLYLIISSLFFNIGRLTLTPLLVPREGLISFNALNERVSLAGRVFGPWAIGSLILETGQGIALGLAGALFAFSAWTVYRLPGLGREALRLNGSAESDKAVMPILSRYREPFRGNNSLKGYFLIFGFLLLGGAVLNFGLPIYFKTRFGRDIADWGLILSGFQAGSCLSTFILPRCSSTFKKPTIFTFSFLIIGGAMALLGQLTTYTQVALLMILFGFAFTLVHLFLESLIQQTSPRDHMGKTISLLTTYKGACYLGTILTSALVITAWGPRSLLLMGAFIMLWASLLIGIKPLRVNSSAGLG